MYSPNYHLNRYCFQRVRVKGKKRHQGGGTDIVKISEVKEIEELLLLQPYA
jgi:hypothetical protein